MTGSGAPAAYERPIPIEDGQQVAMLIVTGLCFLGTAVLVVLRFIARRMRRQKLDASDFCICAALFFNSALIIDCWVMVFEGGFGFHVSDIAVRFGPDVLTLFYKGIMAFCLLWTATTLFTKLSILLLYTSLFPLPSIKTSAMVVGGLMILWSTGSILTSLLMCRPIATNWDSTLLENGLGTCGDFQQFYMALGVINIVFEAVILVMPIPVIYQLKQLPLHKRLLIIGLFAVGFATCATSIYRQASLVGLDFRDMTHSGLVATLFSALEPSVALMLACVPLLRPVCGGTRQKDPSSYAGAPRSGLKQGSSRLPDDLVTDAEADNDNSSEVQLRPLNVRSDVWIGSDAKGEPGGGGGGRMSFGSARAKNVRGSRADSGAIKVETQWVVKSTS